MPENTADIELTLSQYQLTVIPATTLDMADFAAGTWKLESTENFDEYMKAVGVGLVTRKMAAQIKPTQVIAVNGDKWNIKTQTTLKNTEIDFELGKEFDESTADGRKVKTTCTLEGQKLIADQKGEPDSVISREWNGDTMTMLLTANGAECKRIYKRES